MEVQNRDVYERHLTEIDTWASEFQGQEDIALEAVQSLHIALEEGNMSVSNKSSSITCALDGTCSKASDFNERLKVKREHHLVQDLRDRLSIINKDVTAMVDEHWIPPQKSGNTPAKSHRSIAEDDDIPNVPKKEFVLRSNGFETE
ncbi:unnamed protein product, partial [Strongylus vulgaris]